MDPPGETHTVLDPEWKPSPPPPPVWSPASTGGRRGVGGLGWAVAGALAVMLVASLVVLWPGGEEGSSGEGGASSAPVTPDASGLTSAPPGSVTPSPSVTALGQRYWVEMFAPAGGIEGYTEPSSSSSPMGTLDEGRHWVLCRRWGARMERTGTNGQRLHNHWWMLTRLDRAYGDGGSASRSWVSALYLTRWGNDEAKDDDGREIPQCPPGDLT